MRPLRPYEASHWAQAQQTGNVGRKAVLMALAEFADEWGSCFPSQALLAEVTEQSVRTIREQLAWLRDNGLIEVQHRARQDGQGRTSNRYYLRIDLTANLAGSKGPNGNPEGASGETGKGYRQSAAVIGELPPLNSQDRSSSADRNEQRPPYHRRANENKPPPRKVVENDDGTITVLKADQSEPDERGA